MGNSRLTTKGLRKDYYWVEREIRINWNKVGLGYNVHEKWIKALPMSRHLRSGHNKYANGPDGSLQGEGYRDNNGILHTSSRSLRKINYAEIESEFDFLEKEDGHDDDRPLIHEPADSAPTEPANSSGQDGPMGGRAEENEDEINENYGFQGNGNGNSGNRSGRARSRGRRTVDPDNDDESFHEEDIPDEDDDEDEDDDDSEVDFARSEAYYAKRRRQREDKSFVVSDPEDDEQGDEDEDEDEGINYYRGRRGRRGRGKRGRSSAPAITVAKRLRTRNRAYRTVAERDSDDNEDGGDGDSTAGDSEALSLREEIRELQEDSPVREKRSLRERTKPVNYKLPPALTEATADDYFERQASANALKNPSPRGRRGRNYNLNAGPARRLFPTGGPFGGNDVTTIFGKNTNFYHQGTSAMGEVNNANSNSTNKLILDSDSSDDEILPLGAKSRSRPDSGASKNKKKQEIADLDPLGVDMNVKFQDVGGLDNYIDQLKEMVALPLLYPELYANFDITPPRGVLFHGPPGTGKTLMARALAASCSSETRKITFFMRKGADVLSKWVGEAERQLRLLFEEAKKQQPSVIFFDEIDGLAPVRSSKQEQIHASIVSTLLALMDGMDNRGQVIVIGATNRPDAVDPALRRPGRFDREFYFPLPDIKGRQKIIKIHTKNWKPPLSDKFIQNLATLTKGFGGADIRALCTEAALLSIQRKYPQIYRSNEKLCVDPTQVKVGIKDFMIALKKIVPSSARSSGDAARPLPDSIKPLLQSQLETIIKKVEKILQKDDETGPGRDSSLIEEYLEYEDICPNGDGNADKDGDDQGFARHEMLSRLAESRICNPKLLITGPAGNGQQYIGAAILHYLERFNVQKFDLASLLIESSRTVESAIIHGFVEARRQQPSVIFIPNIDIWSQTIPETAIFTLTSLFRSLPSSEKVFLLGISESQKDGSIIDGFLSHFSFSDNICHINVPSAEQRSSYFESIVNILHMKPFEFKTKRKRRKPLPPLPPFKSNDTSSNADMGDEGLSSSEALRRKLKTFQHQDMRLKNILKIKLSGLMDLFKNRYKRFRKPPIEDDYLVHLFEPPTDPNWQPAYTKDNNMILEIATGRRFFNMDLDIIEERLWNGYYSEPKQYLKDIELIYRDANTMGDRERIIKASEMFANAQMGIEDMSTSDFIRECKATRIRDLERQELFLRDEERQIVPEQKKFENSGNNLTTNGVQVIGVGDGNQLQAQLQVAESGNKVPEVKVATSMEMPLAKESTPNDTANRKIIPGKTEIPTEESHLEGSEKNDNRREKVVIHDTSQPSQGHQGEDQSHKADVDLSGPNNMALHDIEPNCQDNVNGCSNINNNSNGMYVDEGCENYSDDEDTSKGLIIDESVLHRAMKVLEEKTEGYTTSRLQEIYSKLVDVSWEDRFSWDKSETLEKILHIVNSH